LQRRRVGRRYNGHIQKLSLVVLVIVVLHLEATAHAAGWYSHEKAQLQVHLFLA
jgi:hypothetical protein